MSFRISAGTALGIVLLLTLSVSACAPSLSPLYRDYEIQGESIPVSDRSVDERIKAALAEAGWQLKEAAVPNAFATEERKLNSWGIYSVVASVEVVPMGTEYVRLYIHPYRTYITGGRGKIPYLKGSLRRSVLNDLTRAFEAQGLQSIGTGKKRDEATASR